MPTISPCFVSAPSPVVCTVRSVFVTFSGASKLAVGFSPIAPFTVTESDAAPDVVAAQVSAAGLALELGASDAALPEAHPVRSRRSAAAGATMRRLRTGASLSTANGFPLQSAASRITET